MATLKIYSSLTLLVDIKMDTECFHSGPNFGLRPEILDFFKGPKNAAKKPEKSHNFTNIEIWGGSTGNYKK